MPDVITADRLVLQDDWSHLADLQPPPAIDLSALRRYRLGRLRREMARADVALCLLSNPLSLRYAADLRRFAIFQARVPLHYLAVPVEGPVILYGGLAPLEDDPLSVIDTVRPGRALTVFEGGFDLGEQMRLFKGDLRALADELRLTNKRLALETMSPWVTQALLEDGYELVDAQALMEPARRIKSAEEVACLRWAIAVTEHGMAKLRDALRPGVRENQLWALLNYVTLANDGEWHDSQQLTSGPRTNPPLGEAGDRVVQAGDLVAFDTDTIGPFGYCADISRTFHCGPRRPSAEQRDLYRRALNQLRHNTALVAPGVSHAEIVERAFVQPEGFHRFDVFMHGVGMSDELPFIPMLQHEGAPPTEGVLEPGMVLCVEAYAGRIGGPDGVKLEDQVLVTETGHEVLSRFPFEKDLLA